MNEGIEAYFGRVNGVGGVAGRRLKRVALDDGCEVDPAVANTRRLIDQEKVFGLLGYYGTASSSAVLPVIEPANGSTPRTTSDRTTSRSASSARAGASSTGVLSRKFAER